VVVVSLCDDVDDDPSQSVSATAASAPAPTSKKLRREYRGTSAASSIDGKASPETSRLK
jgi:hypothetical protein